jgi:hypothetical protein
MSSINGEIKQAEFAVKAQQTVLKSVQGSEPESEEEILNKKNKLESLDIKIADATSKLEDLKKIKKELDEMNTDAKKAKLKEMGSIKEGSPLEEMLKPEIIRDAQIGKFFEEEVFEDVPDPDNEGNTIQVYSKKAALHLLESAGILEPIPNK